MRGLYPIVDLGALERAGLDPLAFAERVLAVRPALVQLRAKQAPARSTLALLRALVPLCRARGALLFANDRPDLAALAGADGVHVGQDDLAVDDVRRVAPALRIGISTHRLSELDRALAERPDYVAFGPVFATASKLDPEPVVGIEGLALAAERARRAGVPLVAIGGIDLERAAEIGRLGAAAAVIGALLAPTLPEVEARARQLHIALGAE